MKEYQQPLSLVQLQYKSSPSSNPRVKNLQKQIFGYLNIRNYQVNYISITQSETLYTIHIKSNLKNLNNTYYLGTGFGGSALMYFPFLKDLLKVGDIVLWQIRGMGLNQKNNPCELTDPEQISSYFLQGIAKILNYYKHKNIIMLCHSFSAYLILLYSIKFNADNIDKLVLLSPVGITPKENDYKNKIRNCSDIWYTLLAKFGWTFKLSYKSPLRTICKCCKEYLLRKGLGDLKMSQEQKDLILEILLVLIQLPDGSQAQFFQYFEPRVLPKIPIQPIFKLPKSAKIYVYFGGEEDWVDRQGTLQLCQQYREIKVQQIQNCGHQIPLDLKALQKILWDITNPQTN